jgi:dUTP pyrophosphatase
MIKIYKAFKSANYRVAYGDSQGIDLASLDNYEIEPLDRVAVRTGIHISLPKGTFGLIKERSGLALKNGIITIAGVIDNSYRGEIIVLTFNVNKDKRVLITKGEFIAQLIVINIVEPFNNIYEVNHLEELGITSRGEEGFGSSGGY